MSTTYARLFPPPAYKADADRLFPAGCTCLDDSGSCDWCAVYYSGPEDQESRRQDDPANSHGRPS